MKNEIKISEMIMAAGIYICKKIMQDKRYFFVQACRAILKVLVYALSNE